MARRHAPHPAPREATGKRSLRWLWIAIGAAVAALVLAGAVYALKANNAPLPGTHYPSQGNMHINPGDSHPVYNSDPPTSGWHYPVPPNRGIYTQPLPQEWLVHFMEHAGVVIWYNAGALPPAQIKQLQDIVKSELNKGQGLVLLAPSLDSKAGHPIALTAWQQLEYLDSVTGSRSKIEDFVERLQCHYDPENVCGGGQHGQTFIPTGTPAAGQATVVGQPMPSNIAVGTAMPSPATPAP